MPTTLIPVLPRFREYAEVREYLYALKARGVKVGLERMQVLARLLGHPERCFPVLHVAGTNGKGSTSAMLEAILRRAGWRTGLYTSPHLVHQAERIQVNRQPITEERIVHYVNEMHSKIEAAGGLSPEDFPSFFEFMTGMAFLDFAERRVDVAVVEVGLGGRLDATNIVDPEVSVVTSIGFDHVEILGRTLAAIAGEKAGILKPGKPVVMGRLPPEAAEVVRRVAQERGCALHAVEEVFGPDTEAYPRTNLEGDYQRWNAGTATVAARVVGERFGLTREGIESALQRVTWMGRWERLRLPGGRELILDASHNPEGAEVLDANLSRFVAETGVRPVVVCGVLGAFRAAAILPVVARYASSIHLVVPQQDRASSHDEMEAAVPEAAKAITVRDRVERVFPAPGQCAVGSASVPVVVTGSIYLLGEVLQRLGSPALSGQERLQDW